jgi:hypothetical protein
MSERLGIGLVPGKLAHDDEHAVEVPHNASPKGQGRMRAWIPGGGEAGEEVVSGQDGAAVQNVRFGRVRLSNGSVPQAVSANVRQAASIRVRILVFLPFDGGMPSSRESMNASQTLKQDERWRNRLTAVVASGATPASLWSHAAR